VPWSEVRIANREQRTNMAMVALGFGTLLLIGGYDRTANRSLTSCHVWNPAAQAFSQSRSLLTGRAAHAAVLLPDGRVLVTGGFIYVDGGGLFTTSGTEIYDQRTERWQYGKRMIVPRAHHEMLLLPALNIVLVVGGVAIFGPEGVKAEQVDLDSCEFYDIVAGTWSLAPRLSRARFMNTMALRGPETPAPPE
jgi:hypothetical protein